MNGSRFQVRMQNGLVFFLNLNWTNVLYAQFGHITVHKRYETFSRRKSSSKRFEVIAFYSNEPLAIPIVWDEIYVEWKSSMLMYHLFVANEQLKVASASINLVAHISYILNIDNKSIEFLGSWFRIWFA